MGFAWTGLATAAATCGASGRAGARAAWGGGENLGGRGELGISGHCFGDKGCAPG